MATCVPYHRMAGFPMSTTLTLVLMTSIAAISLSRHAVCAQSVGPTSVPGPNPFIASSPSQPPASPSPPPSTPTPSTNACDCTQSGVSGTTNTTFVGCGQWLVAYDRNEFVCFVMVSKCFVCPILVPIAFLCF